MIEYITLSVGVLVLCSVVGAGFYTGVRHVEEMSDIVRNQDRPDWLDEPIDAVNQLVARPPTPARAEELDAADDSEDQ